MRMLTVSSSPLVTSLSSMPPFSCHQRATYVGTGHISRFNVSRCMHLMWCICPFVSTRPMWIGAVVVSDSVPNPCMVIRAWLSTSACTATANFLDTKEACAPPSKRMRTCLCSPVALLTFAAAVIKQTFLLAKSTSVLSRAAAMLTFWLSTSPVDSPFARSAVDPDDNSFVFLAGTCSCRSVSCFRWHTWHRLKERQWVTWWPGFKQLKHNLFSSTKALLLGISISAIFFLVSSTVTRQTLVVAWSTLRGTSDMYATALVCCRLRCAWSAMCLLVGRAGDLKFFKGHWWYFIFNQACL